MSSLYDELAEKLARDPRLTRRGGPRVDLSVLLFNARDDLHELWLAAERQVVAETGAQHGTSGVDDAAGTPEDLAAAVDKLRPIFGDRPAS